MNNNDNSSHTSTSAAVATIDEGTTTGASSASSPKRCIASDSPAVRNVCIIAHVDHGKTTTADTLLAKSGRIQSSKAGETLLLDSGKAEAERGITISAKNVTLIYPKFVLNHNYYINNLPHTCDVGDVAQAFVNYGVEDIELHAKRGYGYISLSGNMNPTTLTTKIEIGGRVINVSPIERSTEEQGVFIRDLRLNLVDSPGHSEFSAQVSSSLRICDGALLVVDAIEGVCTSTEILLRNAIKQGVVPVLLLNKADRLFLELNLDPSDAISRMQAVVNHVNMIVESEKGTPFIFNKNDITGRVIISSGYFGWGTSIPHLIDVTGVDSFVSALRELAKLHKSIKKGNVSVFRSSIESIVNSSKKMSPQVKDAIMKSLNDPELDHTLTNPAQIEQQKQQLQSTFKKHLKRILSLVLPMSNAVLESIVYNLPSPFAAQRKRRIYPLFGNIVNQMRENSNGVETEQEMLVSRLQHEVSLCSTDQQAPLVAHIAKGIALPGSGGSSSASSSSSNEIGWVTRVFSGTLKASETIRVITDYGEVITGVKVIHIYLFDGKRIESVPQLEAGNVGVLIIKIQTSQISNQMLIVRPGEFVLPSTSDNGTTVTKEISTYPFVPIPHEARSSVSAALRLTSQTNAARTQRRIAESLEILSRIDPAMSFYTDSETKDLIISGSGELHLEVVVDSLKEMIGSDAVELGNPVVALREIATEEGKKPVLSKSTNKLNNVSIVAVPLDIFTTSIANSSNDKVSEDGQTLENYDSLLRELETAPDFNSKCIVLSEKFGWSSSEIKKIWAFGPEQSLVNEGTCIIMNSTVGMQNIGDIQDSSKNAFQRVTSEGIIPDTTAAAGKKKKSKLRGVVFRIVDAKVHTDSAHRRPQQIEPMVSEGLREAFMECKPIIVEPIYRSKITCSMSALKQVQKILDSRDAKIVSVVNHSYASDVSENESLATMDHDFVIVECDIAVSRSFGLVKELGVTARGTSARKPLVTYEKGGWASLSKE